MIRLTDQIQFEGGSDLTGHGRPGLLDVDGLTLVGSEDALGVNQDVVTQLLSDDSVGLTVVSNNLSVQCVVHVDDRLNQSL